MQTKLTLRLDDHLIDRAKRYAHRTGKSVSQLVAEYFALIESENSGANANITPRVQALVGSLKGAPVEEEDYRRHLEEKYR